MTTLDKILIATWLLTCGLIGFTINRYDVWLKLSADFQTPEPQIYVYDIPQGITESARLVSRTPTPTRTPTRISTATPLPTAAPQTVQLIPISCLNSWIEQNEPSTFACFETDVSDREKHSRGTEPQDPQIQIRTLESGVIEIDIVIINQDQQTTVPWRVRLSPRNSLGGILQVGESIYMSERFVLHIYPNQTCGQQQGWLIIHELLFTERGEVSQLAVDVHGDCTMLGQGELQAYIRFNTNWPVGNY